MVKYRVVTLDEVEAKIDPTQLLFYDSETFNTSKHYAKKFYGRVRLAQFMQEGWDEALIVDMYVGKDSGNVQRLRDLVYSNNIVGHTVSYDYQTLQEEDSNRYREIDTSKVHDTLHLMREVYPISNSFALPMLYQLTLGYNPYDQLGLDKKKLQKMYWGGLLDAQALTYAAADVYYYPQAYRKLMEDYATLPNQELLDRRIENAHIAINAGLKMQSVGFCMDFDRATDYVTKHKAKYEKGMAKLQEMGVSPDANINSSPQMMKALALVSTDKYELSFGAYRDSDERCSALIEAREGKYRVDLVTKWSDLMTDYGFISGKLSPTTTTGRFQSSQENMQNSPRDIKEIIIPNPTEPDIQPFFIGFDFSQIELRTMCALTGEKYSYEVYKSGGDIHQVTQDRFSLPKRVIAKNVNFGLMYGMGIETFQKQLVVGGTYLPEDRISLIKQEYKNTYPYTIAYHSQTGSNCSNRVPNYTLMGTPHWSLRFTEMVNRPNQASGTKEVLQEFLRLCYVYQIIDDLNIELSISVHDSVLFNYRGADRSEDVVRTYATLIAILAQKAWFTVLELGFANGTSHYDDVPMPISVGIGETWQDVDDNEDYVTLEGTYVKDNPEEVAQWLQQVQSWRRLG